MAKLQAESEDKPETNVRVPQQERYPGATKGKDIAEYNLDINYMNGQNPKTS